MKLPCGLTWDEWHCLVIGYAEGMNPRKRKVPCPKDVVLMIADEYWYYTSGYGLAAATWGGFIAAVILLGWHIVIGK